MRSARPISSSSCSTTTSVLPLSRRAMRVEMSRLLSRACRPMLGSSRTYSTPGEVGAELRREADALGLAPRERLCRPVEREVAQAHVVHEPEPLPDLRDDVARDEPAPLVEVEGLQVRDELRRRACEQGRQRERGPPPPEMELHGPGDPVEPLAAAVRAEVAPLAAVVAACRGRAGAGARAFSSSLLVLGLEHPRVDPAVPAAGGAPAPRRVEREILGVELGEGLPRLDVGARRREPGEDLARRR